jgi:Arsenate reductase and related proteins, glutaredoxin family
MPRDPISPDDGACHKRRNDDCASSFRSRDNVRRRNCAACLRGLAHAVDFAVKDNTIMKAVIYHNPMCGTSRKTLEILRESGAEVRVQEYLRTPPSRDELERLYARAGVTPREGLRAKEPLARELGLTRADVSDDEVLDAMMPIRS